jgi:hypothetical protein
MIKSSHQLKMNIWGLASPNFVSMRPLKNKFYSHESATPKGLNSLKIGVKGTIWYFSLITFHFSFPSSFFV